MEIIENFKTKKLKLAEYNPRQMDEEEHQKLKEAIEYHGLVNPIIFNTKTGVIISGNQRYKHIKKHDTGKAIILGDIGWFFLDDDLKLGTESDEKALNIALNKIKGKFENTLLKPLINEIMQTETPLIAYNDMEINEVMALNLSDIEITEPLQEQEYDKLEVQQKQMTYHLKKGDTWNFHDHALKVGEINPDQEMTIKIKNDDLHIRMKSTDNIQKEIDTFKKENKKVLQNQPNIY